MYIVLVIVWVVCIFVLAMQYPEFIVPGIVIGVFAICLVFSKKEMWQEIEESEAKGKGKETSRRGVMRRMNRTYLDSMELAKNIRMLKVVGAYNFSFVGNPLQIGIKYNGSYRVERPIAVAVYGLKRLEVKVNKHIYAQGQECIEQIELKIFLNKTTPPIIRIVVYQKERDAQRLQVEKVVEELSGLLDIFELYKKEGWFRYGDAIEIDRAQLRSVKKDGSSKQYDSVLGGKQYQLVLCESGANKETLQRVIIDRLKVGEEDAWDIVTLTPSQLGVYSSLETAMEKKAQIEALDESIVLDVIVGKTMGC